VTRIPGNLRRTQEFDGPAELARFFRGDRLETIPARASDRRAVLMYIARVFEHDREYAEADVNLALARINNDHASLRRYLVDAGILVRDHGLYRRA
jgi:hypothetical protein